MIVSRRFHRALPRSYGGYPRR